MIKRAIASLFSSFLENAYIAATSAPRLNAKNQEYFQISIAKRKPGRMGLKMKSGM
jgi:hypothetical protein